MRWTFAVKPRSMANRDPVEAEFFREGRLVPSVVRESIQNSLDAADGTGNPVRVRFSIPDTAAPKLSAAASHEWFQGYEAHLRASELGSPDLLSQDVPLLIIEDFQTTGLEGPVDAEDDEELPDGENAGFFYFWRNVGRTGKAKGTRGSWGLGKAVYAMASQVRCKFGLTIRHSDNGTYLMGQSELKIHRLDHSGTPKKHIPDGWFGEAAGDDFVLPVSDATTINRFRKACALHRSTEPGLSLVVPHPHEELTGEKGSQMVLREVVRQYVFPILSGDLVVEVNCGASGSAWTVDKDSVESLIKNLDWKSESERDSIQQLLDLAFYVTQRAGAEPTARYESANVGRAEWTDLSLDEGTLTKLKSDLLQGDLVHLRVPVGVRKKSAPKPIQTSFFDVYLHKIPELTTGRVHFVRQGLLITDVTERTGYGIVGVVVIEDAPLAGLLRAAENPAHTRWLDSADRLRKDYTGGAPRVRLCKRAPGRIIRDLFESDSEVDYDILSDLFPDSASGSGISGGSKTKPTTPEPPDPPPASPKTVAFRQAPTGFVTVPGKAFVADGSSLTIEMAYDIARGNAFSKWERFDFTTDQLTITTHHCSVVSAAENRIEFTPEGPDFRLEVSGFCTTRDLIVRLR